MKPVYYFALCAIFLFACSAEKEQSAESTADTDLPRTHLFMSPCPRGFTHRTTPGHRKKRIWANCFILIPGSLETIRSVVRPAITLIKDGATVIRAPSDLAARSWDAIRRQ